MDERPGVEGPPRPAGLAGHPRAAQQLTPLEGPLGFASRAGLAALGRVSGLGEAVAAAVTRARAAGAPESEALRALESEGRSFEARGAEERRRAVARMAGHLAALVPVPEEVAALAARGRLGAASSPSSPGEGKPPAGEMAPSLRASGERAGVRGGRSSLDGLQVADEAAPGPHASPPEPPLAPEPRDAEERAQRRARLRAPLSELPRIHPATRALLEERGHLTVEQALSFWPKAYQDRTRTRPIAELRAGEEAIALGTVRSSRPARMKSGKPLLHVEVEDGTGRLALVFFNPPAWRMRQLAVGETLLVSGKVTEGFGGRRQMRQPEVEKLQPGDSASFGRIVPFYAGPADHQHPALRRLMKRLCDELAPLAVDGLPAAVRSRRGLLVAGTALRQAHFPPPGTDPALAAERATPAFRRLVFEELFFLQLALALRRRGVRREHGIAFDASPERLAGALALLPFAPTGAQRRALEAIAADMARPEPMNRLLQGDVGSGKTAVAFVAMMLAVRSGWQAALMAPTEILAEQHARTLGRWLEGSGVELVLVAAQTRGKAQREARQRLASGQARLAVGTHALLEDAVGLERLGLVVVDEQHRFGVLQRARLIAKGQRPDVLVMTATPIPRTLALTFHGDLDQTVIDELPPGRTPIETRVFGDTQRRKAHELVRRELAAGHQVYVVYPLVAESEKSDLADATSAAAELTAAFAPFTVGLLHGQMKADEKERVMEAFRAGRVAVLVTTTVIEVGVDVPNATVLVVEHAERFGLSQLHQLRGRVGRGAARSHCLLVAHFGRAGGEAKERLKEMERTQDGFAIARADLRIRGPGELVGTKQSGQKLFEIADLYRDEAILEEAREEAFALVEEDPALERPEHAAAAEALAERWSARLSLAEVG